MTKVPSRGGQIASDLLRAGSWHENEVLLQGERMRRTLTRQVVLDGSNC